jgi:translation initiation factor 2D
MFIKPFKIKNNIQLKGSDVKKLKSRISAQFSDLSDDNLNILIPNKSSYSLVKLETSDESIVNVYARDKKPMFFEVSGQTKLYPTLYSLWIIPDLVPYFTTNSAVSFSFSDISKLTLLNFS